MKKLKIILLLNIIVLIGIFLKLNNKDESKYSLNDNIIYGYITNYKINNNKLQIELKGKEKILVNYYLKEEIIDLKLGDYVKIEGTINVPSNNTNFNLFNYKHYLKSKKINYIFKADKIIKIKNNNKLLYKIKNNIIKRINKINNNYLYAFILGDTYYLDNDIKLSFRENGISHLFAVSGMHITLISMILLKILKNRNKYIKNIIVFSFLIFYMFLTSFTPSVIRATILFISLKINELFNLKIKSIYFILLILNIMLFVNPFYIYNIGFILSFIVSISLILFGYITNNYNNYFIKIFITSVISFLISIPIMINNNNEINLISPFVNVIFVPFISLIVFPLSLITFFIPIFNPLLNLFINIFESLSIIISKLDIFTITLKEINYIIFILYYILIIFIIKKLINKKYKYLIILLVVLLIHNNSNYLNKYSIITMLDVGQGDSIFIELPHNKGNILIDTGGIYSEYSIVSNITIPYFKSIGIKKINYLILSHGDYDHMGEAINLINNFKVEKVVFNCGKFNDLENELIKTLDKKKIPYYSCIKKLNIDDNKLYFLQTKEYDNENDNSNVIYTEINNYKFMFMGDASSKTEKEIMSIYDLPYIDVLKVGHHGANTSSSVEFVNKINTKYSLISVGKNNRYGHPKESVLETLKNSKIYRTDLDGSIEIKLNKNNKIKIETCT